MDDDFIVTVYVVLDETMRALAHRGHPLVSLIMVFDQVWGVPDHHNWLFRTLAAYPVTTNSCR
jgi:hypothetical protein